MKMLKSVHVLHYIYILRISKKLEFNWKFFFFIAMKLRRCNQYRMNNEEETFFVVWNINVEHFLMHSNFEQEKKSI